jgi:PAS domain S-box-containing protein
MLLAGAYFAAAKFGLQLAYLNGAVAALWPPVGIGIAALVLWGPRLWPGIVIGDLLVANTSAPVGTVLGQVTGNVLEIVLAAVLLRRLFGNRVGLTRVAEVLGLVVCASLGILVSATFGTASLRLGGVIGPAELAHVWRTWWLSDFSGALIMAPVVLTWVAARPARFGRRDAAEALALGVALVLLVELPSQTEVPYVVFPAMIWAALRFGPIGASSALLVVASLTVWNTAHNAGPFVRDSTTDSLLATQLFLAAAALTSLVLAAVTAERRRVAAALRANEARLRSVVGSMAEGLIVRDRGGIIRDCNDAAERIIGVARDRLCGHRPAEVMPAAVDPRGRDIEGDRLLGEVVLRGGEPEPALIARLPRAGGEAWVSVSSSPVRGEDDRPAAVVSTVSDITESRHAEQRLVASERANRRLAAEQAALRRVATLVAADQGPAAVFAGVTEEVAELLDVPSANIVRYESDVRAVVIRSWSSRGDGGLAIGTRLPLDDETVVAKVRRSGEAQRIDAYPDSDGVIAEHRRARGLRASVAAPVRVSGQLWGALVASAYAPEALAEGAERKLCDFADLIAQALANADAHERLASSRARIVEAGDVERRRLERNLHDGAQQRLVSLALRLRLTDARLEADPARARNDLASASAELAAALDELRELARGIHPAILTDQGLAAAVTALAGRSPVLVEIEAMPAARLPTAVETAAYYVIAEAITNSAKYADASRVIVRVEASSDHARVEVGDDGIGGADPAEGSGLRGIADRVDALRGRLHIVSPRGQGTVLEAEIPLAAPDGDAAPRSRPEGDARNRRGAGSRIGNGFGQRHNRRANGKDDPDRR